MWAQFKGKINAIILDRIFKGETWRNADFRHNTCITCFIPSIFQFFARILPESSSGQCHQKSEESFYELDNNRLHCGLNIDKFMLHDEDVNKYFHVS